MKQTHLNEANCGRLLAEALTAEVKPILANKTSLVSTEAAAEKKTMSAPQNSTQRSFVGKDADKKLTTGGYPCRICEVERTKQRRASFCW